MAFMAKWKARRHYNDGTRVLTNVALEKWTEEAARNPWKLSTNPEELAQHLRKNTEKLEEGAKHLHKSVELDPSFAFAFHNLAHIYYNIAEYVVFTSHFEGCQLDIAVVAPGMWHLAHQTDLPQRRRPDEQRAEDRIAGALESALEAVDQALTLRYDFPQAHNTRAMVLGRLGRLDEAIEAAEVALLQYPTYTKALDNREKIKQMKSQI